MITKLIVPLIVEVEHEGPLHHAELQGAVEKSLAAQLDEVLDIFQTAGEGFPVLGLKACIADLHVCEMGGMSGRKVLVDVRLRGGKRTKSVGDDFDVRTQAAAEDAVIEALDYCEDLFGSNDNGWRSGASDEFEVLDTTVISLIPAVDAEPG